MRIVHCKLVHELENWQLLCHRLPKSVNVCHTLFSYCFYDVMEEICVLGSLKLRFLMQNMISAFLEMMKHAISELTRLKCVNTRGYSLVASWGRV